jgi:hypothetical protein
MELNIGKKMKSEQAVLPYPYSEEEEEEEEEMYLHTTRLGSLKNLYSPAR